MDCFFDRCTLLLMLGWLPEDAHWTRMRQLLDLLPPPILDREALSCWKEDSLFDTYPAMPCLVQKFHSEKTYRYQYEALMLCGVVGVVQYRSLPTSNEHRGRKGKNEAFGI